MPLEGYTVDYAEPDNGKENVHNKRSTHECYLHSSLGLVMNDAKYFFKAVREGDVVTFATNEENERHSWVQALYRATGQSHKPTPPITATTKSSLGAAASGQKEQAGRQEEKISFLLLFENDFLESTPNDPFYPV